MNEENVMTTNEMNREERMPFFRIPKVILTDEKYVGLSEDAMLLYGILLDRRSLSERNDWRDKKGDVFVYCTLETIQMTLRCAHQKATKLLMELEKVGADIPLLIGGATTSQLHTALKIAPVYHAPVVHLKDASQNATVAARLMNPKAKEELKEKLSSEYQRLREKSVMQAPKTVSLEEAQKNKLSLF